MRRILATALAAASFFQMAANADETVLDGLVWRYDATDGGAIIRGAALPAPAPDVENAAAGASSTAALEELKVPAELGGLAVVAIGDDAFNENERLREVKVPEGVKRIGSRAFKDCRSLRSVKLPDSATEIGDRAFSGCRALKSVSLGAHVTNIAERTFRDCRSLGSIDLPECLASIGEKAFADCAALHVVTVPHGVTNIAGWAFADCAALSTVVFLGAEPAVGDDAFARVGEGCFFRASAEEGWSVKIPGTWQGRNIVDLAIETYRRTYLIFLPSIVGAIGTIAILILAIVLRERKEDDDEM